MNLDEKVPRLSVILVTPDTANRLLGTLESLRRQTVHDQIEIIIVGPQIDTLDPGAELMAAFSGFRLVPVGEVQTTGRATAAGVLAASAPVVAYGEEHAFPDSRWAEAHIRRHKGPWSAVGGLLTNANPDSAISWAHFFLAFGPWIAPREAGETTLLPWHHTSYKREVLLDLGYELGFLLEVEGLLHQTLRERGDRFYLEPGASSRHVNVSLRRSLLHAAFWGARLYAGGRAKKENWGLLKRMFFILASPLLPLVLLRRSRRDIQRVDITTSKVLRMFPDLLLSMAATAVGEMAGYGFGAGEAGHKRVHIELDRSRHLNDHDLETAVGGVGGSH